MKAFFRRIAILGLTAALAMASFAAHAQTPIAVRPPLLRVADAKQPVVLQRIDVSSEVVGTLARTRVDLVLHNPNDRVLEGELQFPLLEGQTVAGFALDIGGRLRPAVPVEKAKGQQVFEEIVRGNADPALLEKSQGNNFKLRVYPLPVQGDRRLALLITENLVPGRDGRLTYRLPLNLGDLAGSARMNLRIAGIAAAALKLGQSLQGAVITNNGKDTVVEWRREGRNGGSAPRIAEVSWAAPGAAVIATDRFEDTDYFYAEVPVRYPAALHAHPRNLVILWDASGSGANRDHARELAFLDAFFKRVPNLDVSLIFPRHLADSPSQRIVVTGGNWQELRRLLEAARYDGATNPAAWKVPAGMAGDKTLALLFSDGLANWGDSPVPPAQVPLYAVNASATADPQRLRALAEKSGGGYLDLLRLSPDAAVAELAVRHPRLVALQGRGIVQLVSASERPEGGRLLIAGQLEQETAEVTLILETPKGERVDQHLAIKAQRPTKLKSVDFLAESQSPLFPGLAAQRWGSLKVAALEADRNQYRAEIRRQGNRFGLVTGETSLIVLETLSDYLRYEIVPPAGDLRVEYEQKLAQRNAARQRTRSAQLDDVARRFAERVKWWETDFPKGEPPKPEKSAGASLGPGPLTQEPRMEPRAAAPMFAPAPVAVAVAPIEARRPSAEKATADSGSGRTASIQLQKWQPDAPYARRLREAVHQEEAYGIYLDERPDHLNSTAFFLDAAEIFFDKGMQDTAIQILSNLAEMDLENRHILRILAYRLQQAGGVKLALPLLKRIKELAPHEPQSWRDLGLAYAANGQMQEAVDTLWEVVSMPSEGRFADIDLIALAEMNALIAGSSGLDTARLDSRLLRNLALDLRAVLTWDADNTDIDLWVIDPNGEKAYFGHPLTYQGGRMSRDFTAGYGPEEFALKAAKPGRYEVRAHFFGHRQQVISPYTTLMLRLSTGFGTSNQKDQDITLRLSGRGDGILVGTFEVKDRP